MSGVDVVTAMLLSLESVLGIVLTGTETNEVTNTTCHINAGKITGQAMQPQSYILHSYRKGYLLFKNVNTVEQFLDNLLCWALVLHISVILINLN